MINKKFKEILYDSQPLFWLSVTMLSISVMIYSIVFAGIHFHLKLLLQYLSKEENINSSGKILFSLVSLGNWNSARNETYLAIKYYLTASIISSFNWTFQKKLISKFIKIYILIFIAYLISFSVGCWYFIQALDNIQTII